MPHVATSAARWAGWPSPPVLSSQPTLWAGSRGVSRKIPGSSCTCSSPASPPPNHPARHSQPTQCSPVAAMASTAHCNRRRSLAVADSPLRVIINPYESSDSRVIGYLMLFFDMQISSFIQD